jgi:hypothetical protein
MNDRAVQDKIIRYLADATARAAVATDIPIENGEKPKTERFARFLARRYYRDRLARSFRYSRGFRTSTGRVAEQVIDAPDFGEFLLECVLGSLPGAERVAEMARHHLMGAAAPGPWWSELIEYECAYFLQAATSQREESQGLPAPGLSGICRRFGWGLPEMVRALRTGQPVNDSFRRECILLFSRTHAGRIYVVEGEPQIEKVFRATDGHRTPAEIAAFANLSLAQVHANLSSLAAIGAVQFPG